MALNFFIGGSIEIIIQFIVFVYLEMNDRLLCYKITFEIKHFVDFIQDLASAKMNENSIVLHKEEDLI